MTVKVSIVESKLDLSKVERLEVGSGEAPRDGYTHLDIRGGLPHLDLIADFGELPFENNQLMEIFCSQVIEHIPRWRRLDVLREWYRVLRPGGVLRGNCPNLDGWLEHYVRNKHNGLNYTEFIDRVYGGQEDAFNVHYTGFTPESLKEELYKAEFTQVNILPNTCWTDIHFAAVK